MVQRVVEVVAVAEVQVVEDYLQSALLELLLQSL
jgi:hypothetical protein